MLPRFYPILDTAVLRAAGVSPIRVAEEVAAAGVKILQFRHKDKWTQSEFDEARTLANLCAQAGLTFVINDRADFAQLLAAGLHIGQDDLPPLAARKLIGNRLLGFSTHNAGQLRLAATAPVDYVSVGPIFATRSKEKPDPVVGVNGLRALRPLTQKPLCAIGGITLENASSVLAAGADCLAIISALLPLERRRMIDLCSL